MTVQKQKLMKSDELAKTCSFKCNKWIRGDDLKIRSDILDSNICGISIDH